MTVKGQGEKGGKNKQSFIEGRTFSKSFELVIDKSSKKFVSKLNTNSKLK
jgi:hypothetical protein